MLPTYQTRLTNFILQNYNTVLHDAVSKGNKDMVYVLLSDDRCEINAKDKVSIIFVNM